jgi:hypothetical protein
MPHSHHGSLLSQVESIQRQFAQAPGLPFAQLLPTTLLHELRQEHGIDYRSMPRTDTPKSSFWSCHRLSATTRSARAEILSNSASGVMTPSLAELLLRVRAP